MSENKPRCRRVLICYKSLYLWPIPNYGGKIRYCKVFRSGVCTGKGRSEQSGGARAGERRKEARNADGLSAIITDDPKLYQQIHGFLQAEQPEDLSKLQFYEEQLLPLSKLYSTDIAVERALKEYVWLKNGAYLVIQPTEALTVVDVNSGKYSAKTKKKSAETYLKINLEAAKETARQIRLRNISG